MTEKVTVCVLKVTQSSMVMFVTCRRGRGVEISCSQVANVSQHLKR